MDVVFSERINLQFEKLEDGTWTCTYENAFDAQGQGDTRWEALMDMAEKLAPTLSDDHY